MPKSLWQIPEGLRVLASGRWRVGELDVSRGAHQTLLQHAEEESGRFFLRAGTLLIPVRT